MFEDIPEGVDAKYLSGFAAFVRSGGDRTENMEKQDFAYVLNEYADMARVRSDDEGRAVTKLVSKDNPEYDDSDYLGPEDYSNNILADEVEGWAGAAVSDE